MRFGSYRAFTFPVGSNNSDHYGRLTAAGGGVSPNPTSRPSRSAEQIQATRRMELRSLLKGGAKQCAIQLQQEFLV